MVTDFSASAFAQKDAKLDHFRDSDRGDRKGLSGDETPCFCRLVLENKWRNLHKLECRSRNCFFRGHQSTRLPYAYQPLDIKFAVGYDEVRKKELQNAELLICVLKQGTTKTVIQFVRDDVPEVNITGVSPFVSKMQCAWSGKGTKDEAIQKLLEHPDIEYVYADTFSDVVPLAGRPPLQPPTTDGKSACEPHDPNLEICGECETLTQFKHGVALKQRKPPSP
jgi:hypothetical protein